MKLPFTNLSLRWRLFLATSITITLLFGVAGWFLERNALRVADENVRSEIRSSMRAYQAVWRARTEVLTAVSALMSSMSDVRAAFLTRDPQTIRDSADELWSRVSGASAVFLVLSPEGQLIAALGEQQDSHLPESIPVRDMLRHFPKQLAGYIKVDRRLYYVVLTPVYVQTSGDPLLLNVLCAGFRIDNAMAQELQRIAPASRFVFRDAQTVFASTLPAGNSFGRDLFASQALQDLTGKPVAELRISTSYAAAASALAQARRLLAIGWLITVAVALFVSSFLTRRLLVPLKDLDHAAVQIAAGNYDFRVPVRGGGEFSRFALTFNHMCDSIQQAQSELIRQEQISTIGRLGSSLVHDLRNPLAAIFGGAEMLVDSDLSQEQTKRVAASIYKASQRIQELLQDLLAVSRGVRPELENCRLRDVVEAAGQGVLTPLSGAHLSVEIAQGREVLADRTRLERVFTNLISNAEEAITEFGRIRVYEKESATHLDVYVEDDGAGIPSDIRSKIFEPFVTGKRSGLGLGLAFSRNAMRDIGGDLLLSEFNGSGTCFIVRFPKATAQ